MRLDETLVHGHYNPAREPALLSLARVMRAATLGLGSRERACELGTTCYFHVNGSIGIVQKIDFEIRPDLGCTTLKMSRKVVLDNPSVCLSV